MALVHQLHTERLGHVNIRTEPIKISNIYVPPVVEMEEEEEAPVVDADGWVTVSHKNKNRNANKEAASTPNLPGWGSWEEPATGQVPNDPKEWLSRTNVQQAELKCFGRVMANVPQAPEVAAETQNQTNEIQKINDEMTNKEEQEEPEPEPVPIACVTGDFTMQNVLLQMGMHIVSPNGKRITKIKRFGMRCHACNAYVYVV